MQRIAFELSYLLGLARAAWHSDHPSAILARALDSGWLKPGDRVLEVGCGLGTNTEFLAAHALDVTGVDVSGVAVLELRRTLGNKKLRAKVYRADFFDGLDERPFDAVFARATLHSFPKGPMRSTFARRLVEQVRRGGTLLLTEMRHDARFAHRKLPPFGIDGDDMRDLFGAEFEIDAVGEELQHHRVLGDLPFAHWRLLHKAAPKPEAAPSNERASANEGRG